MAAAAPVGLGLVWYIIVTHFIDTSWVEGDYLVAYIEDVPSRFNPDQFDATWCDESEIRYFDRLERRLLKLIINQKDLPEVIGQYPVKFPVMKF